MQQMLDAVPVDFVSVQFYNNYCGAAGFVPGTGGGNYNFATWDQWARGAPVNAGRKVKVLLGLPGSPSAGNGYVSGETLRQVVEYSRKFESFGGVMIW